MLTITLTWQMVELVGVFFAMVLVVQLYGTWRKAYPKAGTTYQGMGAAIVVLILFFLSLLLIHLHP